MFFRQIIEEGGVVEDGGDADDEEENEGMEEEDGGEGHYSDAAAAAAGQGRWRGPRNVPGMMMDAEEDDYDGEDDETFFRDGVDVDDDITPGGSFGADSREGRWGGGGFRYPGDGIGVGGTIRVGGGVGGGGHRGDADAGVDSLV